MTYGTILVARRRSLKMTQDHLAGAATVSRSTVQRAERGLSVSDENLRSLLAVLGLTLDDLVVAPTGPQPGPAHDPAAAEEVVALESILVCAMLIAFVTIRYNPDWFELDTVTAESASRRFWFLVGYLGLGSMGSVLAGRVAWRRWRIPDADRLAFHSWHRAGRITFPLPGIRWVRAGIPAKTWKGGLIAAFLVVVMTFLAHHPSIGALMDPSRPALGFDPSSKLSGAWTISPGSPLAKSGIRLGDLVTTANGMPVFDHLDLVAAVRDAEGKTLALTIERPRPRPLHEGMSPSEKVTVDVEVQRDPAGCQAGAPCGWAGELHGLFMPTRTWIPFETQVAIFLREARTVAGMILDPELRGHSELRAGHDRGFRLWLDWLTFRMAAGSGITLTFVFLASILLVQQVLLTMRRGKAMRRPGGAALPAAP